MLAAALSLTTTFAVSDSLALYLSSPSYLATTEYSPALSNATVTLLVCDNSIAYSFSPTLTITIPVAPSVTSTAIVVSAPVLISLTAVTLTVDLFLATVNVVELDLP